MSEGKATSPQSLDHGEVLLEIAKRFEDELQKFCLSLVLLNELSLLQTFQLYDPLLDCVFQITGLDRVELTLEPRGN